MDKLSNIIAFSTVAETLSFAEAAKRLAIAPSVVSKRIKDLEAHLGATLLNRSTRHVSLTDAGYRYAEHSRRLLGELAELEDSLRDGHARPVGHLTLSAPMAFTHAFMGPLLSSFLGRYPDVSVDVLISDDPLGFARPDCDLGIFIGTPQADTLVMRKIADTRRVVVGSPAYLAQHGRPHTPADLIAHNCLKYAHEQGRGHASTAWPFSKDGREVWQPVMGRMMADSGALLARAARDGCGLAFLPTFIVAPHIMAGELDIVLEDYERAPLPISVVWPHQRHMPARLRALIDHIVAHFQADTPPQPAPLT